MSTVTLKHAFEICEICVSESVGDSEFFRCENLGFFDPAWRFGCAIVLIEIECLEAKHILEVFYEG